MTTDRMTLQRFEAITAAYGARPDRWPAAERDAANALLADSAAARTLLEGAAALDGLLDMVPAPAPAPTMRAAILAAAPRAATLSLAGRLAEAWRAFSGEFGGFRAAGPVLAASLLLGVAAGSLLSDGAGGASDPDLLQLALLDEQFAEY
ncbi:hypothetical protein [Rhodospirillaceae bacterium SYSU D60014]|uniref:hypothetical protein n=1 Tax=Virgifigura deserti TaxID=2268457 RepID=UPI000E6615C8